MFIETDYLNYYILGPVHVVIILPVVLYGCET